MTRNGEDDGGENAWLTWTGKGGCPGEGLVSGGPPCECFPSVDATATGGARRSPTDRGPAGRRRPPRGARTRALRRPNAPDDGLPTPVTGPFRLPMLPDPPFAATPPEGVRLTLVPVHPADLPPGLVPAPGATEARRPDTPATDPATFPPHARPWRGMGSVTGGGLALAVTPEHGILAAWSGENRAHLPEIPTRGRPPRGQGTLNPLLFPGGWARPLDEGHQEWGFALDRMPVILLLRRDASGTWTEAWILTTDPAAPETLTRMIRSLPARLAQRRARGLPDEGGLRLSGHPTLVRIDEALAVLDDATLEDAGALEDRWTRPGLAPLDGDGAAFPPGGPVLVGGVTPGGLRFLSRRDRVEVGLGALVAGRWSLAWALLSAVLADAAHQVAPSDPTEAGEASAAGLLLLAARWGLWTGEGERLRRWGPVLDEAVEALMAPVRKGGSVPDLPAAFPSRAGLLRLLADAVEPLGVVGWVDALRETADEAEAAGTTGPVAEDPPRSTPGPEETSAPGPSEGIAAPPPRRLRLPVVGGGSAEAGAPEEVLPPRPAAATFPLLAAFASPHHPSVRERRTLHAARILRAAVEGFLGAEPDAVFGRIRLGPALPEISSGGRVELHLAGLRVGDAQLALDCRIEAGRGTFRAEQTGGRVPLNAVFEPLLPFRAVRGVHLREDEDRADVTLHPEGEGTRLGLKFPLDPEARIDVDGSA